MKLRFLIILSSRGGVDKFKTFHKMKQCSKVTWTRQRNSRGLNLPEYRMLNNDNQTTTCCFCIQRIYEKAGSDHKLTIIQLLNSSSSSCLTLIVFAKYLPIYMWSLSVHLTTSLRNHLIVSRANVLPGRQLRENWSAAVARSPKRLPRTCSPNLYRNFSVMMCLLQQCLGALLLMLYYSQ